MMAKQATGMAAQRLGKEKYLTYLGYVLPMFVLYLVFFVAPLLLGVYYSLFDWNGFSKKYNFIGIANYTKALGNAKFHKALLFNLRYSVMLIVCVLVIAMILALVLNRSFRMRSLVRAAYFFPATLSMLTVSLIFNEIFYRALPALGEMLGCAALQNNILSSKTTAIYGVLITHVWQGVAIPTVLLMAGLQTIPTEIIESSAIDGATPWKQFWHITVPFLLPTISVIMVLLLRDGLMVFDYIFGLTEGGPGGATRSITMLIYQQGFEEMKFSYAISESLLIVIALAALSLVQIKISQRKQIY